MDADDFGVVKGDEWFIGSDTSVCFSILVSSWSSFCSYLEMLLSLFRFRVGSDDEVKRGFTLEVELNADENSPGNIMSRLAK